MNAPGCHRIRRATTDDLARLLALWEADGLPGAELEKRFTEFQVAESPDGSVAGAIGLQMAGSDGKIHSETFADFAWSDTLRPLLWQHLEEIARSHGLLRLWTEESAPFWKKGAGFSTPPDKPPEAFGPPHGNWLALRLRDESADPGLIEAQFNLFRDAERARSQRLLQRAAALKTVGTLIAALLFIFALCVLVWFVRHRGN